MQSSCTTIRFHHNFYARAACGASAAARFRTQTQGDSKSCSGLAVKQSSLHHKTQEPFEIRASAKAVLCRDVLSGDADRDAALPAVDKD